MSASIDKGQDASEDDSRRVLSAWLDDYIAGRCDRAKMHESFLDVCRSNPEAPWDALALLDQYQRRGRVDVALARSLKTEIAQLVFGVANQTEVPRDSEATLDTTGSRWRKLYAERGSLNVDEPPIEDPVLGRDFDPLTRPPAMAHVPPPPVLRETPTTPAAIAIGVGTLLRDRYELMEVLGREPSGTLFQAFDRHRSHLPSPSCYVAVRVLQNSRDAQGAARAQIEREAYEAQSLSHPNIVSVFDLDRHQDIYFVVMELLDGEPLSEVMHRLAGKPMSRERAFAVIGAVGAALMYAHRRNLAHGDLKPAAVVLTTNGDVKVRDFGFARSHALDRWEGGEPSVDGVDANTTAAYASAERVGGEAPHPRDDVYSLACIAYELLSGRHPYGGRSAAMAQGRRPQKISGLSLRQWNALQAALHWNRAERRIDVAELLAGLDCIDAPPQGLAMPAAVPSSSLDNPFGRGKGVLLAMLLVVAAAIVWWQWPRFIELSSVSPVAGMPSQVDAERSTPSPPTQTSAPSEESTTQPSTGAIFAPAADPPAESAQTTGVAQTSDTAAPGGEMAAAATQQVEPRGAAGTPSIEFDKDTYVATEGDGLVTLTVRRNGSTRGAVRFRWALRANSAEPGSDYAGIGPDIEEIPAGSRTTTITIPLVMDATPENTELFLVELEAVDGGPEIGAQAHAAVIIVDDD